MDPQRHGFINSPVEPKDFIFGGKTKLRGEVIVPDGNWEKYLFEGIESHQAPEYETNACVSHSSANALELLKRRMHDKTPDFSDRFIAKGSGTNPAQGNTFKAVADFIRKSWAVYENEWPIKGIPTINEYYNEIPEPLFSIAKGRKRDFGYERITNPSPDNLHEAAKRGVVVMSIAYMPKEDGTYFRPENWADGHAITFLRLLPNGLLRILDSYPPFIKDVHPYVPDAAYRYGIDELQYSLLNQLAGLLKQLLEMLKNIYYPPETNPKDLPMNKPNYIHLWATAIKDFEGFEPGSISYRNNNPGNIKSRDGNFLKFNSYIEGFAYLQEYLKRAATGKHAAYKPTFTMKDFINVYAPSSENSSASMNNYAAHIIKRLDITETTQIGTLV